jgi:hypothetical protein
MSLSHGAKLLIGVLMLGCISAARADQVTYNLQTYTFPDIEPINMGLGYTDTLSGTITLTNNNPSSSVFTTYNQGDSSLANVTISMTLTLQSSSNTIVPVTLTSPPVSIAANVTAPSNYLFSGSLMATPSGLYLSNPGYLNFDYIEGPTDPPYITGHWDTAAGDDGGAISIYGSGLNTTGGSTMQVFPQNLDSQPPPEFGTGSWLIAVPEPSSILLLSLGVLGFLARRRLG